MFVEFLRRSLRDPILLQSFSGVRTSFGMGSGVSPEHSVLASAYGYCYAKRCAKSSTHLTILIGRDPRPTGQAIASALARGFMAATHKGQSLKIVNIGIITTPLLQSAARAVKADGAVMITASHNPLDDNGWKFLTGVNPWSDAHAPEGALLSSVDMRQLVEDVSALAEQPSEEAIKEIGSAPHDSQVVTNSSFAVGARAVAEELYVRAISEDWGLQPDRPDLPSLGPVLLDPNGGAACGINRRFLEHFGVRTIEVNRELGKPNHTIDTDEIDPATGEHVLTRVARAAREHGAKFGIAFDYDADRGNLVLPGEDSSAIVRPQAVAALNVMLAMSRQVSRAHSNRPPAIVASENTSGMTEQIARSFGAETFYVETGEINVVTRMYELRSLGYTVPIGIEGANGGTIFYNSTCRDGVLTALSTALAEIEDRDGHRSLADLLSSLPSYHTPALRIETTPADHGAVKSAIEDIFAREVWPSFSNRFKSYTIYNYEGTMVFSSTEAKQRQGGWKLVLEAPDRKAFLFARGSRTEAGVWRLGADSPIAAEAEELLGILGDLFDRAIKLSA